MARSIHRKVSASVCIRESGRDGQRRWKRETCYRNRHEGLLTAISRKKLLDMFAVMKSLSYVADDGNLSLRTKALTHTPPALVRLPHILAPSSAPLRNQTPQGPRRSRCIVPPSVNSLALILMLLLMPMLGHSRAQAQAPELSPPLLTSRSSACSRTTARDSARVHAIMSSHSLNVSHRRNSRPRCIPSASNIAALA